MIITSTNYVENKEIDQYLDIVFGEVIEGINFLKDVGASFKNFLGGRSKGYEKAIIESRKAALEEMEKRALDLGADAVIAVKFDYETIVEGMLMITCSGTAVKFK